MKVFKACRSVIQYRQQRQHTGNLPVPLIRAILFQKYSLTIQSLILEIEIRCFTILSHIFKKWLKTSFWAMKTMATD